MKIKSASFWKTDLDLVRPYTIAYKTVSSVANVFIELELENGMKGIGACNPSKQVIGKDANETFEELQKGNWQDQLVGKDIRTFEAMMRELHLGDKPRKGYIAALDIALFDLWGKFLDQPIVGYLGQQHSKMPTSITIGIKDVEESLEEADEYVGRGFRYLKVKIGEEVEKDLERLQKLRERFRDLIHIRVDANQAYTLAELISFWEVAQNLDIELIEQPMPANEPWEQLPLMQQVPAHLMPYIALDESLRFWEDAHLIAGLKPVPCGIFNIKLMKCGGIYPAMGIARSAQLERIKLMWGCNDESIVSITAALHAAFANKHTAFLDLDGSLDLARDLVSGGFTIEDGMMSLHGGAGLGVEKL
ncbi:MAG: dipeptide epimerase [Bacteroidia bacterium]|nr:dipeptide epimerase [Bacteroidia bacterium]